ncbi:MAG TPA: MFS transporter [Thermoplasmata archaeon]|nr:MFS transporter [Thermoplasmata archaeon]
MRIRTRGLSPASHGCEDLTVSGFLTRRLNTFFGLEPGDVRNLSFLYFATFVMRAAAFAGVAVMQHVMYPDTKDQFWKGLLFAVYPLAEIVSVGYFGALCDRLGRKRILVLAHLVTAAAVFLFIPAVAPPNPFVAAIVFTMFGIGAAAKVASTLAMVNDHATSANRAQLFAFFDLVTFGGLVGGFGAGFLALNALQVREATVLAVAGAVVMVSVVMVQALVRETDFSPEPQHRTLDLLRKVLSNPDIRRLLPVYVPVVALYGYVLTFTDHLIGTPGQCPANSMGDLVKVVLSIGAPLGVSLAVSGRLSDRFASRRPFMGFGLACFGGLAVLLALATRPGGCADLAQLASRWPLIVALAAGAGTFPPAALAYLGDIVTRSISGTTFGIYSIIFGSGLIIGPVLGGTLTEAIGPLAFGVIALGLIAIAGVGVAFIREPAKSPQPAPAEIAVPPEMR